MLRGTRCRGRRDSMSGWEILDHDPETEFMLREALRILKEIHDEKEQKNGQG